MIIHILHKSIFYLFCLTLTSPKEPIHHLDPETFNAMHGADIEIPSFEGAVSDELKDKAAVWNATAWVCNINVIKGARGELFSYQCALGIGMGTYMHS